MEGLIFGGPYLWGEICVSKSIGLASQLEGNLPFFLCFTLYPSTIPRGGLYLEGRFKGGFFALRVWGLIFGRAYTWRGLFSEFYGIRLKMRSNPDVDVGAQQGNPRLA